MNGQKRRGAKARLESRYQTMSSETKDFIQKICYKKSASIDMTKNGFMKESKVRPINLLMKPLQEQLEKICGKNNRKATNKIAPLRTVRSSSSTVSRKFTKKRNIEQKHIFELINESKDISKSDSVNKNCTVITNCKRRSKNKLVNCF